MSTDNVCPSCGAPLQNNTDNRCPSCGIALNVIDSSTPTIISNTPMFDSSASSMDEVKRLIREGNTDAAEEIASIQFGLSQEAAHNTVEQTVVNMKYSGHETLPVEPAPVSSMPPEPASSMPQPEVVNSPSHLYDEPQKPSNSRKWIIAGSIGAVVFLCMCCCIPVLILIITSIKNNQ